MNSKKLVVKKVFTTISSKKFIFSDLLESCADINNGKWFKIFFERSKNQELEEWFKTIANDNKNLFLTILKFKIPTISKFILGLYLMKNLYFFR